MAFDAAGLTDDRAHGRADAGGGGGSRVLAKAARYTGSDSFWWKRQAEATLGPEWHGIKTLLSLPWPLALCVCVCSQQR